MIHLLIVAFGGAFGAAARHLSNLAALRLIGPAFPWGTVFVNITGSLLMGFLIGWLAHRAEGTSNELRLLLTTGFLGGFTTFSAFSLDFATLWRDGLHLPAVAYVLSTVLLSLLAIFLGLWIMRAVL